MQTYQQTFASATTWELNVSGSYFATLECTQAVNVRFYSGGTLLDLGEIKGLAAGLEVTMGIGGSAAFDRVQVDVQAGDTVKIGIGNGQARYNRGAATVTVAQGKAPQAAFANTAKTITSASAQLVAANSARQYLMLQNKDTSGFVWINHGAGAATQANGVRIPPGGFVEYDSTIPTGAIQAIGDIASNANIVVVEG